MFPNYDVDQNGNVYKNGSVMKPFKSNKYLQVVMYDKDNNKNVFGVHTVVAMKYLDGFHKGCIIHHKDGNTHNNSVENLEVFEREEHSKLHNKDNNRLADYVKTYRPWNKGKKMNDEYRNICKKSALKRGFNGNQYVDKYGNRKEVINQHTCWFKSNQSC